MDPINENEFTHFIFDPAGGGDAGLAVMQFFCSAALLQRFLLKKVTQTQIR